MKNGIIRSYGSNISFINRETKTLLPISCSAYWKSLVSFSSHSVMTSDPDRQWCHQVPYNTKVLLLTVDRSNNVCELTNPRMSA